jgi:inhibitor of KinA sporulation pathway (predicted exonuclease)
MDYVIVDLEATCWEGSSIGEMETIEIGAVYLDGLHYQPVSDFGTFVKPSVNPMLTDFCRQLTHIRQNQIDSAPSFAIAFGQFVNWAGSDPWKMCSWGGFDNDLLMVELQRHKLDWPPEYRGHINLKHLFAKAYNVKPSIGLREAMRKLSMPFEGTLHRGIDDAKNISRVAQTMLMLDR